MYSRSLFVFVLVGLVGLGGCVQRLEVKKNPLMHFSLNPVILEPGHSMKAVFESDQPLKVTIQTLGQSIAMDNVSQEQGIVCESYIGIPLDTIPDRYSVTLTAFSQDGAKYTDYFSYTVRERSPFKISRLWIKSFGKYDFDSESLSMKSARATVCSEGVVPKFDKFIWPVKGRISEIFGTQRIYNGGKNSWYHGGIDIAAPGGTTILAPADGVVIMTRAFEAHGNATLIYHGFGIVTTFLHQKVILVQEGQRIKCGEKIGEVGTTGSSTGNHLHFQVNIHQIKCDPFDFLINHD